MKYIFTLLYCFLFPYFTHASEFSGIWRDYGESIHISAVLNNNDNHLFSTEASLLKCSFHLSEEKKFELSYWSLLNISDYGEMGVEFSPCPVINYLNADEHPTKVTTTKNSIELKFEKHQCMVTFVKGNKLKNPFRVEEWKSDCYSCSVIMISEFSGEKKLKTDIKYDLPSTKIKL